MKDITPYLSKSPKIAIVGAHGVGKTTLANRISEALNIQYVPEYARELINVTNIDWQAEQDEDAIVAFEKAIASCYSFTHAYLADSGAAFVTDRTLLDVVAYCMWHMLKSCGSIVLDASFVHFYREVLEEAANSYRWYDVVLFYRPIGLQIDSCGQLIDAVIKELLKLFWADKLIAIVEIKRGDKLKMLDTSLIV